ncbi:retinol dehydrogenase 14b [Kryptolebias marmoratus]|uniref:Retinol dehydrogenase 14b n=1 Tax=Kryptolebias marmoratus TaxID=37003 RepID=A0A3Q3BBC2_KRYMA|nr:retinol dehydrogenase 14b [Kryptolebias marmoratus]
MFMFNHFRVNFVSCIHNTLCCLAVLPCRLATGSSFMATSVLIAAVVGGGVLLLMRRLFPRQKAAQLLRYPAGTMRGKTVIVTGANSGIGKALAGELLKLHARVIMACRDLRSAEDAAQDMKRQAGPEQGEVVIKHLDLASLRSVKKFCEEVNKEESRVDVLVNNAGIYQCPYTKTEDGFEMQLGVNHLGHFLLTHLLLDLLKVSAPSRIVVVSSKLYKYGHISFNDLNSEGKYNKAFCYSQSKLANLLFTLELARQLEGTGVTVNALTPGIVRTKLGRHVQIPLLAKPLFHLASLVFFKSPLEGAQTPLYLACSTEVEGMSGKCFANCEEEELTADATDEQAAKKLWDTSRRMVGLANQPGASSAGT